MKKICFYCEKGGSGKTLLTALFACYLAYKKGERVVVFDTDDPSYQLFGMRENDESTLKDENKKANLEKFVGNNKPFVLEKIDTADVVKRVKEMDGEGYLLIDFPGRYASGDPIEILAGENILDAIIFPVDTDRQTRSSVLNINTKMTNNGAKCPRYLLWNRVTPDERKRGDDHRITEFNTVAKIFGIRPLQYQLRESVPMRRSSDEWGFIRNTVCWPETNIKLRKLEYIENLMEEIKRKIDEK